MTQLLTTPGEGVSDERGAVLSNDGCYRYWLWRDWDPSARRTMAFVMLNPSTADAVDDDPTISRCTSFARREGCGRLEVVNLFAYRATKPADLIAANQEGIDVVGCENLRWVEQVVRKADIVVLAYGAESRRVPHLAGDVRALLARLNSVVTLYCLGVTRDGYPRHPLYVRGDAHLSPIQDVA